MLNVDVTFDLPTIFLNPIVLFNGDGFSSFVGIIFAGIAATNANVTAMDLNGVLAQMSSLAGFFTMEQGYAGAYPTGMGI